MVTVPDSCSPSDSSNDSGNNSNTSRVLDESLILHYHDLPESSAEKQHSQEELSNIATAMIELQQAEDALVKAIQTVLRYAPESASELSRHISPSIQERLDYSADTAKLPVSSPGSSRSSCSSGQEKAASDMGNIGEPGLVPFNRGKKEARKPSYKIY